MPDSNLLPAIKAALRANEIGSGDPYKLSFALLESSGASFGIFQGDTAQNPAALATLRAVLTGSGMAPFAINSIRGALSQPCPVDPLDPADEVAVNAALASPQGIALVDAMDGRTLAVVGADLDMATSAAAAAGNSIDPEAQLATCLWCNMSGQPTVLLTWLAGFQINEPGGVIPAPGNPVSFDDMHRYLGRSSFFTSHPRNWAHFAASVAIGAVLLPS